MDAHASDVITGRQRQKGPESALAGQTVQTNEILIQHGTFVTRR